MSVFFIQGLSSEKQEKYNQEHGIVPKTISKSIFEEVRETEEKTDKTRKFVYNKDGGVMDAESLRKEIKALTKTMQKHAENLEFEQAAQVRDLIHALEDDLLLVE